MDEARKRAKQAAERRKMQRINQAMVSSGYHPDTFADEEGSFTLETHETDDRGNFVGSQPVEMPKKFVVREIGWKAQALEGVPTTVSPISLGEAMEEAGEDKVGAEAEEDGDELVRIFQFDD